MENQNAKNSTKTILTIVISLAFAGLFMWLALRDLDIAKIKESLAKANYFWVFGAMIFAILAYWFRAVRWNLLLEPIGYQISTSNSFWAISFGYLMNLTIPRSGELARSTALFGVEKVPVEKSFGTIILERVVDFVCMLGFLVLTLLFKYDAILSFYQSATEEKKKTKIVEPNFFENYLMKMGISDLDGFYFYLKIFIVIIVIAVVVYLFIFKKEKLLGFGKGVLEGLQSIFLLKKKGKFILLSLAIWVSYFFAAYLVCFALPETADFTVADGFFILVVGTFGMMVPASGGIGAFHLALKLGISALYLSMNLDPKVGGEVGLSYAFISHTMQLVMTLVLGLVSIVMLAKARNQAVNTQNQQ